MNTQGQNVVKTYDAQWKAVEAFQGKVLSKSALEEVKKIYQLAKKEKQEAQLIKAAVYMIIVQGENREDNGVIAIRELEAELASSTEPAARAILSSLVADQYYFYYQTVRWQLYDRTATVGYVKSDISTWGTEDFHAKIAELYLASIQNESLLQKTKLAPFEAIITEGNTRPLRPTLFDLLTHNALKYFTSDEREITKPSYAFEINTASAFDPAADFIYRKFEMKDSTSLEFFAIQLYQKLIAFHLNDPKPDALIDIDLQRIQYINSKSVHPDKDQLYLTAINHVAEQYQKTPAAAQAWYLLAAYYQKRGELFKVGRDSVHQFEKIKAVEICEKILKENPETEGGINAYNLITTIRQKALQFSAENVNVVDKPFLAFVEFKNFTKLYLRLVKATDEIHISKRKNSIDDTWRILAKAPVLRSWSQDLPDTKDYQQHGVEIKVDGLPVGEYVLLASSTGNFNESKAIMGSRMLYVSNVSYVRKENDFFVLDRDTGQPLGGAKVQVWNQMYDYASHNYKERKGNLYITDQNGHFNNKVEVANEKVEGQSLEITYNQDRLFMKEPVDTYYNLIDVDSGETGESDNNAIYLFTDRSLYRPGQTVFYKGIARKGNTVSTDQTRKIQVVLQNVNNESVEETTKNVNEYGSFSGSFVLPQGTLNGQFSIEADLEHAIYFRVEEYKRPKFSVEFDTLKTSYKLNDTIKVTGIATAYAGNTIDGAKVSYRVVRKERIIYSWFYRDRYPVSRIPMEIAHGESITDVSGRFSVTFEAIPDKQTDKKLEPIFDYTIHADVTDSNGETRSAETNVSVGYKSILLKADIPEKVAADSLKNLSVRTENMNGKFVSSDITVKIFSLIPEKRLIRKRYWERPDLFVMTNTEFIANFPHDEYDKETEIESWPEQNLISQQTTRLSENQKFPLAGVRFTPGFYKIQITTKDENGDEIKDLKYIELTNPESNRLLRPQYLYTEGSSSIEPGEKTSIQLATSADHIFVISNSTKMPNPKAYSFLELNDQKKTLDSSATEADRGGYGVSYVFIKHNRIHQHQEVIQVPWTNKDLKISYETFRDKTLPGSKEQWKIKISGYKKDKVAAEMLASMYDASLDQLYTHQWTKPDPWPVLSGIPPWNGNENFESKDADILDLAFGSYKSFEKRYDELLSTYSMMNNRLARGGGRNVRYKRSMVGSATETKRDQEGLASPAAAPMMMMDLDQSALNEVTKVGDGDQDKKEQSSQSTNKRAGKGVTIRKNFNETAFFYPDLKTDADGSIIFSFTLPEALTRWKYQALAHTKELAIGYSSKEIITQKELMLQPNAPRFLREGDHITFPAKIVNLSNRALKGMISLQLFDTETNQRVDDLFKNGKPENPFDIPAGQSMTVGFPIEIPKDFTKTLTWRIVAKSEALSDGEENILPILSNRMLVTESMPISMRGTGSKDFKFEKLLHSANSNTLKNKSLTVEYTSNPAWYAIQSLPFLMEYPYDCAEQTWNRYYANSLAAYIVGSSPRIGKVFESWKIVDTTALLSNLAKNQELKSVLLEETPWVLAAKTEAQQKRNIALLFDMVRMGNELNAALDKLIQLQSANGGFVWFKGGPDDRYMTQYIISGIGHLKKVNALQKDQEERINAILKTAFPYLDKRIREDYNLLVKSKSNLKTYVPGPIQIHYLYMRSFFPEVPIAATSLPAYQYFKERSKLTWINQPKYLQGLTALELHRGNDKTVPKAILKSLKETAVVTEEMGMYWKTAQRGWWWHEAPIERQALLIEAFQEIENDPKTVDDLKTWLLKNKQVSNWESTKATAEACYALLLKGSDWLSQEPEVTINLGSTVLKASGNSTEAGTGYFKKIIEAEQISASMGNVKIQVSDPISLSFPPCPAPTGSGEPTWGLPGWGSIYWQYFEDLDKITSAETHLKLSKKLFIEKNTDNGPLLSPINEGDVVKIGDKIKVRIELRVDRDMEYVHMKDTRASGLEPVNVLSGFKWQGGLGYYESTKDASTNFFFSNLSKGTYVFEYPLFVAHEGDFSNGITSIQCMYAPEFSAHSKGVRVKVNGRK
ncbi:alpha-2-macroglobulin family protein [Dyadobacter arcticus]|uniref:Alpha-2-macroglobulin domain-containing protein n=1 Tax=Dyadobacter arcticus TaxID=1078754 RepID=A0ABX0USB9_9BACT|nr:alpha-2-macroglobulin family protein [Dyadobacter arcticus]NIJ55849.1 hypothetical protein [Dyadobacter arcticus]